MNKIKTEQIIVPNLKNLQLKYPEETETWKQFAKLYGIFGWDMDLDAMDVVEGMPILHVPALTPKVQLENTPSPEQFLVAMTAIDNGTCYGKYYDEEDQHRDADGLMCNVLRSLGYGDGVAVFNKMHKWYS